MLAYSSQLWIQRPLNVQKNAAKFWQMTSLKDSGSIVWNSFACAGWENTRSAFSAARTCAGSRRTTCSGSSFAKLAVEEVLFRRPDRTMMTLNCRWMDEPTKITNCHCPASMKRVWNQNARSAVLPNVFRLAGLVDFDDWGGGAAEPAAWILGDDEMKNTSHHKVTDTWLRRFIREVWSRAMETWPLSAFQTSSLIGVDYGGISDRHNMVVVVAKKYVEEKHGGASEPSDSTKGSGAKPSGHTRRSAEAHRSPQGAGRLP